MKFRGLTNQVLITNLLKLRQYYNIMKKRPNTVFGIEDL